MVMNVREFRAHYYPAWIVLTVAPHEWYKLMRRLSITHEPPGEMASVSRFEKPGDADVIVIHLDLTEIDAHAYSERLAIYAHEAVHVSQQLGDTTGTPLDRESQAYLVQQIVLWLVSELEDWE